jgi:hypothetical protein
MRALALPWLKVSAPGRARASAISSVTLRAGLELGTTRR